MVQPCLAPADSTTTYLDGDATGLRDVDNRIPVRLVTGVAGAGKSAVLRGMMIDAKGQNQAYVVADHRLLGGLPPGTEFGDGMAVLSKGAVCFPMQKGDLTGALNHLHLRRMGLVGTSVEYDGVVVEIAAEMEPLDAIYQLMTDSRLALTYRFEAIVAVINSARILVSAALASADADMLARADIVVATNADRLVAAEAADVEHRLAVVNPFARRIVTAFGKGAVDAVLRWNPLGRNEATTLTLEAASLGAADVSPAADREGPAVCCLAMNPLNAPADNESASRDAVQAMHMVFDGPTDIFRVDAAAQSIAAIAGSRLSRMKWVAATPHTDHAVVFQYIDGRFIHPAWGPLEREKQVRATIVGRGLDRSDILQRFADCRWALSGRLQAPF